MVLLSSQDLSRRGVKTEEDIEHHFKHVAVNFLPVWQVIRRINNIPPVCHGGPSASMAPLEIEKATVNQALETFGGREVSRLSLDVDIEVSLNASGHNEL